jgi:type II secretory pathway predicted ATPase ExeA/chromosome segregation ATPase
MYCDFFGLRCHPFEDRPDIQFLFATPKIEEALATLEHHCRHHGGLVSILGESGVGKSLLVRALLLRLLPSDHTAVITCNSGVKFRLVHETAKSFQVVPRVGGSRTRELQRLRHRFTRAAETGHRCVLVIDQAEHLTDANFAELAVLADLTTAGESLLSVLLLAQPEFRGRLRAVKWSHLRRKFSTERQMLPLSLTQTVDFIRHRLRVAGAVNDDLFDDEAAAMIHRAADGIPRRINGLCDGAMLAACKKGDHRVSVEIVERVIAASMHSSTGPCRVPIDASACAEPPDHPISDEASISDPSGSSSATMSEPAPVDWTHSMASLLSAGEELLDRLEQALHQNGYARSSGRDVADRLDDAEARAASVLRSLEGVVRESVDVEKRIGTAVQQVTVLGAEMEGRVGALRAQMESLSATHHSHQEALSGEAAKARQSVQETVTLHGQAAQRAEQRMAELTTLMRRAELVEDTARQQSADLRETTKSADQAHEKLQSMIRQAETIFSAGENRITAQGEKLETLRKEVQSLQETLTTELARIRERNEEWLAGQKRAWARGKRLALRLAALIEEANQKVPEAQQVAKQIGHNLESGHQASERLQTALAGVNSAVQDAEAQMTSSAVKVSELIRECDGRRNALTEEIAAMNRLFQEAQDADRRRRELTESTDERLGLLLAQISEREDTVRRLLEQIEQRTNDLELHASATALPPPVEGPEKETRIAEIQKTAQELERRIDGLEARTTEIHAASEFQAAVLTKASADVAELVQSLKGAETASASVGLAERAAADLSEQLTQAEKAVRELRETHGAVEQLNERASAALREAATLCGRIDQSRESVLDAQKECHDSVTAIRQDLSDVRHDVANVRQQSEDLKEQLNQAAADLRPQIEQVTAASGQLAQMLESVAEVQSSGERLTADLQSTATRLEVQWQQGEKCLADLAGANENGRSLCGDLQELVRQGESLRLQIEQVSAASGQLAQMLESVTEAQSSGERLTADLQSTATRLEVQRQQGEKCLADLAGANENGRSLCGDLEELMRQGASLRPQTEALRELIAAAEQARLRSLEQRRESDGAAQRLEEVHQSAARTQSALEENLKAARKILATLSDAQESADQAGARMTESTKGLKDETEAARRRLAEEIRSAAANAEKLRTLVDCAARGRDDLAATVQEAQTRAATLAEACSRAVLLAEKVETLSAVLSEAKDTEGALGAALQETRELYESVRAIAADTASTVHRLNELNETAEVTIQRQDLLHREAETVIHCLTERLNEQAVSTETSERLLKEFVSRAEKLGGRLQDLDGRAEGIEKTVGGLIAAPNEIVAEARSVTEHLAKVSSAVRKVFAKLAQSALEARQQTSALDSASRQAQERLGLATQTLQEGIEEALRVQTRLETTLHECPPVEITPPSNRVRRFAQAADGRPRSDASSLLGERRISHSAETVTIPAQRIGPMPPRPDEIAKLIEEAKRSASPSPVGT